MTWATEELYRSKERRRPTVLLAPFGYGWALFRQHPTPRVGPFHPFGISQRVAFSPISMSWKQSLSHTLSRNSFAGLPGVPAGVLGRRDSLPTVWHPGIEREKFKRNGIPQRGLFFRLTQPAVSEAPWRSSSSRKSRFRSFLCIFTHHLAML